MRLSKYVTLMEFERSDYAIRHGIPNKMNTTQLTAAKYLCNDVLDAIREYYGRAIIITSGFRSPYINLKIGGSVDPPSQHMLGEAADFYIVGVPVEQVFNDIKAGKIKGLVYDQLILEFGNWIHISYRRFGPNRRQNLRAIKGSGGKTKYLAA